MRILVLFIIFVQRGKCDSCDSGYYYSYTYHACVQCPNKCSTCSYSYGDFCDSCNDGYYGYGCVSQCSHACKYVRCRKYNGWCTCSDGYYRYRSYYNGHYRCYRCPDECLTCKLFDECTRCTVGYFGNICDQKCRNCWNNTCSIDGGCSSGCLDGFYQSDIGCEACPDNCAACSSSTDCTSCNAGYFGNTCDKKCLYCKNDSCLIDNGSCSNGCKDGYFETTTGCMPCPGNCTICKSKTECTECKDNRFGLFCEQKCSSHCLQSLDNNSTCWKQNGTCKDGCKKEFSGPYCSAEISSATSPQFAMIVGSTSGVVVLVIVVIVVVILMYRRRVKLQDAKAQNEEPMGSREPPVANAVLNLTYDDTDDEPKTVPEHQSNHSYVSAGLDDHVYAVLQEESLRNPAKPNKTHEHGVKDVETDNVYDVSTDEHGPGMHSDSKTSQAEGDIYSHISHASLARKLHIDDEGAYDHVARHKLQNGDDDDTYDVTSGLHGHDYRVQETSKHSADEYSTIRRVQ